MGIIVLYAVVTIAFYTWILCGAPESGAKNIGLVVLWILGFTLFFLMLNPGRSFEMVTESVLESLRHLLKRYARISDSPGSEFVELGQPVPN